MLPRALRRIRLLQRLSVCAALVAAPLSCHCHASPSASELLDQAIRAQGGDARRQFAHVTIQSTVRFKDASVFRRVITFLAPGAWSMRLDHDGHPVMSFGVDGNRCWRKDRQLVDPCSDQDWRELDRIAQVLEARLLLRVGPGPVELAEPVTIDGRPAPAIRSGDLVLVFDPRTHRLIQSRYGDAIESYSDFRTIAGVTLAMRRVMTIGGKLDVDETWEQLQPGIATRQAIAPPRTTEGRIVDDVDEPRDVVWTEIADADVDLDPTIRALEAFARAHGGTLSQSDGVALIPDGERRWRLAIGLEFAPNGSPLQEGALHLDRWPASRIIGVFHRGPPSDAAHLVTGLEYAATARRLVRTPGTGVWVLGSREAFAHPVSNRMLLFELRVQPR